MNFGTRQMHVDVTSVCLFLLLSIGLYGCGGVDDAEIADTSGMVDPEFGELIKAQGKKINELVKLGVAVEGLPGNFKSVNFSGLSGGSFASRLFKPIDPKTVTDEFITDLDVFASTLERLNLMSTAITDEALKKLPSFSKLKELNLTATQITNRGLKHLATMSQLESLDLESTNLNDAGLAHLKGLTNLQTLHISFTGISDKSVEHIIGFSKLRRLRIGPGFSDAGMASLKKLTALQSLDVSYNPITDIALQHLSELKNLKELRVVQTQVTAEGVRQFKEKLPECKVILVQQTLERQ